ncbi:MAG TPA: pitrilysin family protein [Cytophagales bacterium]|nr:pitrilysin family protein [Cytophagales bacterium]
MLDRSVAPSFTLPESVELVQAKTLRLPNGCSLHLINAGEQDVLRLELVFEAGAKYEDNKGSSYFTCKMLSEGTTKHSAKDIVEYFDVYGAFYELHHGPDHVIFTFYCLTKYTKEVSSLIKELVLDSIFPDEELENIKNITIQGLKVNQNKTSYLASVKFKESIFGTNHPYGKILKEEDVKKINRESLISFYNKNIKGQKFNIVLSGNANDQTIEDIINIFGNIDVSKASSPSNSKEPNEWKYDTDLYIINKEDSIQSSLRLGSPLIKKDHPDYFNWVILNEILGGYFGSRLMKNIREDKGFTYGISSSNVHLSEKSYFVIGTDVKKENTNQTLAEIQKEIYILKTTLVPNEELDTVKNYLIGTFLSSINTPFSLADKFKSIYFHKMDYSFYSNYLKAIKNADSKNLLEVANKYLDYEKMVKIVAGGV